MLKDILIERNESVYNVSKKTGIPYSTLSDLVNEKTKIENVQANVVYRLAKYLKMTMDAVYGDESPEMITLTNKGRQIILNIDGVDYQFLGPKNLVAFKKINKVDSDVIYVDTYYMNDDVIYVEEEYVDIKDVLSEYDIPVPRNYIVLIKEHKSSTKLKLMDESLMVSDNMSMSYSVGSADDIQIIVTNMARPNMHVKIRLHDLAVLESNMSDNMIKKSVAAVKRNMIILEELIKEHRAYA